MDQEIWRLAEAVHPQVVADRQWLHRHPELSFQEARTSAYVAEQLRAAGLQPETGIGGYGLRVVLEGERPGPTLALRADMDALPITEETGLPFASVNPGVMHACGHDAHTAMLLGAARALASVRKRLAGRIVLIFQPGEELDPGGASLMIRDGVLQDPAPEAIFGLHIAPLEKSGTLFFGAGPMMAAPDEFTITVHGKGGHAAAPHLTRDPVPAAAAVVTALQQVVSRNVPPMTPAVVTVAAIHGGNAHNVIADQVVLNGTIRTMDESTRTLVWKAVERTAKGAAAAHECRAETLIKRGYPVLVNDAERTDFARRRALRILPEARVRPMEPGMGGEDFAFYLQHIPGSFGRLGVAPPGESELFNLHTSRLKVDENALVVGVAYWLALALGE